MGFIFQAILFVVSTAYQMEQQRKMKKKMAEAADKRKGFTLTISGEAVPLPVAYGKNLLGGIETQHVVRSSFRAATDNSDKAFSENFSNTTQSGSKNEFLNVQYALCHEGIEGVQWVKVNGNNYNSNAEKFQHFIRTHNNGGSADAVADANGGSFTDTFTSTAHAAATFKLDRDEYNYNGVPQMEFLVKGRKVRWIQENAGVYTLSTNYVYSNNPAYCLLDYLLNNEFGRGLSVDEVDLESFYRSANVCDKIVDNNRGVGGQINGQKTIHNVADFASLPVDLEKHTYENTLWRTLDDGKYFYWDRTQWVETLLSGTRPIPLYECNLTLDTGSSIRDNIERILNTMGLAELVWTSKGNYKLLVEHPESQAEMDALITAAQVFTDDDILRETAEISWGSASDRLSQATVNFLNEHEDFKEDTVTWPPTYGAVHNQYLLEDNNQPFTADIAADGITDPYHALASAEQAVRTSRTIYMVTFSVSKKGLILEPGDFIKIDSDNLNISEEIFRVETIKIRSDFSVELTCYRFDYEALAWNIADDVAYASQPVFNFSIEAPTLGSFTPDTQETLGTASGVLNWTFADDIAARQYLVEISSDAGATWSTLGTTRNNTFDVAGLKTGTYEFSIRSMSPSGNLSDRLQVSGGSIQLKQIGQVAIVYANTADELTNTQSYSPGSNGYVAYYSYDSTLPTLPIRSGISFALFKGADGAAGYTPVKGVDYFDGTPGTDGADGDSAYEAWIAAGNSGTTTDFLNSLVGADGADGSDGIPGTPGVDGVTTYTWIKYADNGTGTSGFSNDPAGKDYIGFAFNKTTATESTTPSDYTWSLIKGADGADGADGYTPVKGVDYFDGINGNDGADGDSAYQAWLAEGNTGTTTDFLNSLVGADGANGSDGLPGTDGVDGVTTYTWVKYADNGDGTSGFTNVPTGKDYIGFAFNKTTATESTNPADYTWSLIKGADGADGADGTNGTNGTNGTDGSAGPRGAGWWRYETGLANATTGLSETTLNIYLQNATGFSPTAGDRLIVVNTADEATGYLRNNANSAWTQQTDFLDGDLLVSGTITSGKLASNQIDAMFATIGTLQSAASGARLVLQDDKITVYDASNQVRVKIGNLA